MNLMDGKKYALKGHCRWMLRADLESVLRIEKESFEFPWLRDDFIKCLRHRNAIGMVFQLPVDCGVLDIAGFMIYSLGKTKIELLNFAVEKELRRRFIGKQMMDKLKGKLTSGKRTVIFTRVRESNLEAQLFFRDQGFLAIKVLKNSFDNLEDAYLFEYFL